MRAALHTLPSCHSHDLCTLCIGALLAHVTLHPLLNATPMVSMLSIYHGVLLCPFGGADALG